MSVSSGGPGWWQASDGKWYPPESRAFPPPPPGYQVYGYGMPGPAASNGMATAALVLGIIGVVAGLVPFLFFVALPCGILGLIFGVLGRSRSERTGIGRGNATAGAITGGIAIALGIIGLVILGVIADDIDDDFDEIERCIEDPDAPGCN